MLRLIFSNKPPYLPSPVTGSAAMRKSHAITIRIERQFIAFTGLSQRAFERLLIEFTPGLEEARQHRYQNKG